MLLAEATKLRKPICLSVRLSVSLESVGAKVLTAMNQIKWKCTRVDLEPRKNWLNFVMGHFSTFSALPMPPSSLTYGFCNLRLGIFVNVTCVILKSLARQSTLPASVASVI